MSNKLYKEVMKLSKEAKKIAIEAMEFSSLLNAFVTEDGQIFTSENLAQLHATDKKITYGGTTLIQLKGLKPKAEKKKETTAASTSTDAGGDAGADAGGDAGADAGGDAGAGDPIVVTDDDMKEARKLGVIDHNIQDGFSYGENALGKSYEAVTTEVNSNEDLAKEIMDAVVKARA